ncbi:addiction module protein [Nibricoccus sp. IMCC34717]|uniref:addiction module protein n=1 Tax=Nibricoccus sp. IMCC34717 TaxID=3034021 RepID=UPI00384EF18D
MTNSQKLSAIEEIWSSISRDDAKFKSPSWHRAELERTSADFASGKEKLVDLETAKGLIRKQRHSA